jgi:hypothetical protein
MKHRTLLLAAAIAAHTISPTMAFAADKAASPPAKAADKAASAPGYRVGDKLAPAGKANPKAGDFKLIEWDALMPKDWDPMKGVSVLSLGRMQDGDPQAIAALERLKRSWDTAPTEPAMDNTRVRIAGFVVPLDAEGETLHEFLLVPYFGACIHTPPPPANQVIHVTLATPAKGIRMMDAIWVSGQLHTGISDTAMGTSGYRMDGQAVSLYQGQGKR